MVEPLWESQVQDVVFAINNKKTGNLSDPGTGKTAPSNVFMYYLWKQLGIKTVFVMPKKLFRQNKKSFEKYSEFDEGDIVIVRGTPAQRKKLMQGNGKVFLVTFSFFNSRAKGSMSDYQYLKQHQPAVDACVVDEIHMGFGNIQSQRTVNWVQAMRKTQYMLALTGTLIDGKLSSTYPFIHVVEPRYYFNYADFLNQHAELDTWGSPQFWINRDKVKAILDKHTVRHTFAEIHGEENVVIILETVEMEPKHRSIYKKFIDTDSLELEGEIKQMSSGGETALRARQMLQCPETFGYEGIDLGKDEFILRHMIDASENSKATIIFSTFIDEQKRILKLAQQEGVYARILNGDTTQKEAEAIDSEMLSRKLNIVIGSPACMSVGFDWNHLSSVVFSSIDYKDSNFAQGYRRGIRGKRKTSLAVYVLYYENSVDARIALNVEKKMLLSKDMQEGKKVTELITRKSRKQTNKLEALWG